MFAIVCHLWRRNCQVCSNGILPVVQRLNILCTQFFFSLRGRRLKFFTGNFLTGFWFLWLQYHYNPWDKATDNLFNLRTYKQTHTPTVVQGEGGRNPLLGFSLGKDTLKRWYQQYIACCVVYTTRMILWVTYGNRTAVGLWCHPKWRISCYFSFFLSRVGLSWQN